MKALTLTVLICLASLYTKAQNALSQRNNIQDEYFMNYEGTMSGIVGTLLNGSPASIAYLSRLSSGRLSTRYLIAQSKKFKENFKALPDGGRPSLKPTNAGAEKWWTYTYFDTDRSSSAIRYFLQLKVVFVETNPVPVSKLKIGDAIPEVKIRSLTVLGSKELIPPNTASVYEALKESQAFSDQLSSAEFQKMMEDAVKKR
jgi:predicted transcriptional regulator